MRLQAIRFSVALLSSFSLIFFLGLIAFYKPSAQHVPSIHYERCENCKIETKEEKDFIGILRSDPTAAFTALLFVATVVLAGVTVRLYQEARDTGKEQVAAARESVRHAEIAARAAVRSTEISNSSLIKLQRPFVFLEGIDLVRSEVPQEDRDRPFFLVIRWKNGGNTPTVRARNFISWQAFSGGLPANFEFPNYSEAGKTPIFTPTHIGPQATTYSETLEISADIMRRAVRKEFVIYTWGWFEYGSVLDQDARYRTEFCSQFLIIAADAEDVPSAKAGINMRLHHSHNGADADCLKPMQT